MITQTEESYLKTIDPNKTVAISAYNPKVQEVVNELIQQIRNQNIDLEVLFMGASAIEIAGQNDIDLYILSSPKNFDMHLPKLSSIFGEPSNIVNSCIEWNFQRKGFEVELYITDPTTESMQRQIKVFNILKTNLELRKRYENLKLKFNGKSYRGYQRAKYEFYNEILLQNESSRL